MSVYVDISKKMGSFTLNVQFETGRETLALLGDSGCGKSMTLRCIAGILKPDEGVIRINDRVVFDSKAGIDLKPQERHIGYLFQNYALFPNMTVCENIMVGLEREKSLTKKERRAKALEYVEALHLTGLADHYPAQMSGGQQQRTALARILASKPDILLLDEPFSALDATLRWEMEQVVKKTIQSFEGTAILVSHNRDEVYRLSDKIAVYDNGRIDAFADKWQLFKDPHTAAAARLTGCKNISAAHMENGGIMADDWGIFFDLGRGENTACSDDMIRCENTVYAEDMTCHDDKASSENMMRHENTACSDDVIRCENTVYAEDVTCHDDKASSENMMRHENTACSDGVIRCENTRAAVTDPGKNYTALGIRAHDFRLCEEGAPLSFEYEVTDRIEDTFSYSISIRRRGVTDGKVIRWEIDKEKGADIPDHGYCCAPREKILLLEK